MKFAALTYLLVGSLAFSAVEGSSSNTEEWMAEYGKALSLAQSGYLIDALNAFDSVFQRYPTMEGYLSAGSIAKAMGDFKKAEKYLFQAAQLPGNHVEVFTELGDLYMKGNDPVAAEEAFNKALGYDAENTDALFGLATCKLRHEYPLQSVQLLEKAISLGFDKPQAWINLAGAHQRLGNSGVASIALSRVIQRLGLTPTADVAMLFPDENAEVPAAPLPRTIAMALRAFEDTSKDQRADESSTSTSTGGKKKKKKKKGRKDRSGNRRRMSLSELLVQEPSHGFEPLEQGEYHHYLFFSLKTLGDYLLQGRAPWEVLRSLADAALALQPHEASCLVLRGLATEALEGTAAARPWYMRALVADGATAESAKGLSALKQRLLKEAAMELDAAGGGLVTNGEAAGAGSVGGKRRAAEALTAFARQALITAPTLPLQSVLGFNADAAASRLRVSGAGNATAPQDNTGFTWPVGNNHVADGSVDLLLQWGHGGWHSVDIAQAKSYGEGGKPQWLQYLKYQEGYGCDVDVIDGRNASLYLSEYASLGKPVVLRHLTDDWAAWERWRREPLTEAYGKRKVLVANSSLVVAHRYKDGYDVSGNIEEMQPHSVDLTITLKEFLQRTRRFAEGFNATHDPPYLFRALQIPDLFELIDHPEAFPFARYSYNQKRRERGALFYLGPPKSGAYFHRHTYAWNGLFYGRKYWFLFPPRASYGPMFMPMTEWIEEVLPRLPFQPLQCIQQPGDILVVPQGWAHGIFNTKESIGVAVEIGLDVHTFREIIAQN